MKWFAGLFFVAISNIALADIVNYEAEGNLESTNPASCVELEKLSKTQTPADMFVGINHCLTAKKYHKASLLFFTAKVYGKFDTLRVKDRTAHQAITVLQLNITSQHSEKNLEEFSKTFSAILGDKEKKNELCDKIKGLGAPNYSPEYMMRHGMSAFTGKNKGLIEGFEPEKTWLEVISKYAKCTI